MKLNPSGLTVSDDAKTLLEAICDGNGTVRCSEHGRWFETGGRHFHDGKYARWQVALIELQDRFLVELCDDERTFRLTRAGEKSGLMRKRFANAG